MSDYFLFDLPEEITAEIISFLDIKTLSKTSLVSKNFYQFSNNPQIYKNLLKREFRQDGKNYKSEYIRYFLFQENYEGWGSQDPNPTPYTDPFNVVFNVNNLKKEKFSGELIWTIMRRTTTTIIRGSIDRSKNTIEFKEDVSMDEQIAASGSTYDLKIVNNIVVIGTWKDEQHSWWNPYGAFMVVLEDFFQVDSFPEDFKHLTGTAWSGYETVELKKSAKLQVSTIKIEKAEKDQLIIKKGEEIMKFVKKFENKFVKEKESNSFLFIVEDVILMSLYGNLTNFSCYFLNKK
jgi:hypothetical protein